MGGSGATANAPPQLMQLRQAETFGMVDHHHAGFGHVHAHFHHRGRHQHLSRASSEIGQHRLLFSTGETPMQQTNGQIWEHLRGQFSVNFNG